MFKHLWRFVVAGICMLLAGASYAQGEVSFEISGKNKGTVDAIDVGGITYVNIQKTARKLGVGVELFATSKQAKLTTRGFYAILTASLEEVIINGKTVKLRTAVVNNGGKLMAPVEFFLLPVFGQAIDRYITFQDNKFIVERRFTLVYTSREINGRENILWFETPDNLKYNVKEVNGHTITVVFENVVLKRDVYERFNTDYIVSMGITQVRGNAELKVILGPKAKDWAFTKAGDKKFMFRAALDKRSPVLKPAPAPVIKPEPKEEPVGFIGDIEPVSSPSVLEDDFEEMPSAVTVLEPAEGETIAPAQPTAAPQTLAPAAASTPTDRPAAVAEKSPQTTAVAETDLTVKEAPAPVPAPAPAPTTSGLVIKPEPHPLSISAVHKKIRIVIDPGHGGKDAGAVRGRYREKDWNLAVGNELVKLLKKSGFDVKATRSTDVFIPLGDRAKISNNFKADLFVSIHTNATKNPAANGFQVYFRSEKATDKEAAETAALENEAMQYEEAHYSFVDALLQSMAKNEFMNESSKLSGYIQNGVYKQSGIGVAVNPKTGLRQANFYVLRGVNAPSVLVEMGFISSSKDRAKLSNSSVQKKMAQGIYNGIVQYAKTELKNK